MNIFSTVIIFFFIVSLRTLQSLQLNISRLTLWSLQYSSSRFTKEHSKLSSSSSKTCNTREQAQYLCLAGELVLIKTFLNKHKK